MANLGGKTIGLFTALGLLGLSLAACGGGSSGSSGGGGATTTGGESAYAGPIASTDTATGEARFGAVCASCHDNGAPPLANIGWTPERMRQQIREGSAQMPAIHEARLSATELEAVLAFLVGTGAVTDPAAAPAAAP